MLNKLGCSVVVLLEKSLSCLKRFVGTLNRKKCLWRLLFSRWYMYIYEFKVVLQEKQMHDLAYFLHCYFFFSSCWERRFWEEIHIWLSRKIQPSVLRAPIQPDLLPSMYTRVTECARHCLCSCWCHIYICHGETRSDAVHHNNVSTAAIFKGTVSLLLKLGVLCRTIQSSTFILASAVLYLTHLFFHRAITASAFCFEWKSYNCTCTMEACKNWKDPQPYCWANGIVISI